MEEQTIKKREEKIKVWLKDPYNLALLGLLVFSFLIKIYYFFITKNQPLWYDEADYLNMARMWSSGSPTWPLSVVRPVFIAFLFSLLYKIGFSELTFRFIILLFSFGSIILLYLVAKEMYDKKIALIASFMRYVC